MSENYFPSVKFVKTVYCYIYMFVFVNFNDFSNLKDLS